MPYRQSLRILCLALLGVFFNPGTSLSETNNDNNFFSQAINCRPNVSAILAGEDICNTSQPYLLPSKEVRISENKDHDDYISLVRSLEKIEKTKIRHFFAENIYYNNKHERVLYSHLSFIEYEKKHNIKTLKIDYYFDVSIKWSNPITIESIKKFFPNAGHAVACVTLPLALPQSEHWDHCESFPDVDISFRLFYDQNGTISHMVAVYTKQGQ